MRAPLLKIIVATAMIVTFTAAPSVHAQAPDQEVVDSPTGPIAVRIDLVMDMLSETEQADIVEELKKQFAPISRVHGLYKSDDPELTFRLEFAMLGDKRAGVYVIHSEAAYAGEVLRHDKARTCVKCTPIELVKDSLRIVSVAAKEVVARRRAAAAAAAESITPVEPPVAAADTSSTPRPRLGPLGYVGISSSALGLGATIAGAVLLDRGVKPNPDDPNFTTVINYRKPGKALIGAGVGLMVVSNILIAVDLMVLAPRRRSNARATIDGVAITVDANPGIAVRGRF